MLDKQAVINTWVDRFHRNNPNNKIAEEIAAQISDCLAILNTIMPSMTLAAANAHFTHLTPSIAMSSLPRITDVARTTRTKELKVYFDSLYAMLLRPEVLNLLNEVSQTDPQNVARLFDAAASLHELHIIGVQIQDEDDTEPSKLDPSMALDLLAISHLLTRENKLVEHIYSIENSLINTMEAEPRKVMSTFFFNWAKENQFHSEEYAILNSFIDDANQFFELLEKKLPFKDKGAGNNHGAWAHLMQFYFITEENKKNPFLKNNPIDIYAYLGKPACRGSKPYLSYNTNVDNNPVEGTLHAWDIFFDRFSEIDGRCPDFITKKIIAMEDTPILSEKIAKQVYKKSLPKSAKQNESITNVKHPNKR